MKKSYISPEILVVRIDSEELCQVVVASPVVELKVDDDDTATTMDDFAAPTYRSTLWGNNE